MPPHQSKPLTGRHVWYWLIGFFGLMIIVNTVFIYKAVTSFRGEDVPRSYRQGLKYNQTIKHRQIQRELGWRASYNTVKKTEGKTELIIALRDKKGKNLLGLKILGTLRHPTDTALDIQLIFLETEPGTYRATEIISVGQWQLQAVATQGENTFKFKQDLWV